jgi:hypothetical protein
MQMMSFQLMTDQDVLSKNASKLVNLYKIIPIMD